jgi:hypothetical protein
MKGLKMVSERIKVLFITGMGRSGSTLISSLLGQSSNVFNAGEFAFFWERGLMENLMCSCGKPFSDCATWQNVVFQGFSDEKNMDLQSLTHKKYFRNLNILHYRNLNNPSTALAEKIRLTTKLYQATQAATGCEVIVDSTKIPAYGLILSQIPELDVYFLHLVRDPRAVSFSWRRKKLGQKSTLWSAFRWFYINFFVEVFLNKPTLKYMFMRYEDFVLAPQTNIAKIFAFVNITPLPILSANEHTFSANPGRLNREALIIKPDYEWKSKSGKVDNSLTSSLDFVLMKKYGYI